MSCHPASEKQIGYAESLVEYLEKEQHLHAARIADMSKLIDQMKEIRTEIQDTDKEMG